MLIHVGVCAETRHRCASFFAWRAQYNHARIMEHLQWPKKHRRVIVTDLAVFELDESKMRLTATAPVEHITQVVPAPSSTALRLVLSQGKHVDIACASEDDREVWRSLVQHRERIALPPEANTEFVRCFALHCVHIIRTWRRWSTPRSTGASARTISGTYIVLIVVLTNECKQIQRVNGMEHQGSLGGAPWGWFTRRRA